jgi:membrane fusion protein (multidrug efflux system)
MMAKYQEKLVESGVELRPGSGQHHGPSLELVLGSGKVYPEKGQVRFANNQVDIRTGTVRVVGEFPNPKLLLVPGMFVNVRLLLDTLKGALLVPQRAVTEMQGDYLVAVVTGENKIAIRTVRVGERIGSEWVISGDIKEGDKVVAEGIQKVRDGTVVQPVPYGEKVAQAASNSTEGKPEEKQ